MKYIPVLLLLSSFLILGCKKKTDPPPSGNTYDISIHAQSIFENDLFAVYIDNKLVFKDVMQTNHILSFAGKVDKTLSEGEHTLKIIINNKHTKIQKFTISKKLYIGVQFARLTTKEINFSFTDQPFMYD